MITNMDLDWSVSLDSDWELFGGEIKLNGANCDFDSVALHADSLDETDWQTVEDDVLSVCSSAPSWSCLHGNNLLETYSEMYGDLCKPEDDAKFDSLLSDELIADITSCMSDDLPISLEQFYEINHLVDATAEIDSSDYHYLLLNPDVIVSDVVSMESYGSDPDDVSKISDETDTLQYSVSEADIGTSPGSPDSEVASIECEELYEESVAVVEVLPSTISCEEFEDLMTGNGGTSVIESVSVVEVVPSTISCEEFEDLMTSGCDTDRDLSDDVETARPSHRHPRAELTNSRRLRKKEQNKTAALRYRLKKRSEQGLVMTEYVKLERKNIELRTRLDAMTKEISYLKSLIDELCP